MAKASAEILGNPGPIVGPKVGPEEFLINNLIISIGIGGDAGIRTLDTLSGMTI